MNRRETLLGMLATSFLTVGARAATTLIPPADRELRVPVPGGSIYVRVNGKLKARKAPLLFVHGGPGGTLWQGLPTLPLADERAVILYDQLDSGRSDAPGDKANWTVDRFASEIAAIRKALAIDRLHLLGHSWGGQVATHYAANDGGGLQSLVLQGTPSSAARMEAGMRELLAELPGNDGAIIASAERDGKLDDPAYQKAVGGFARQHIFRSDMSALAQAYTAGLPENSGQALSDYLNGPTLTRFTGALKGFDDEPLLPRIKAPTLLMIGQYDLVLPSALKALLPMLKQGSETVIAGAGHMIQFDQPEAWRDTVRKFIRAHDT